MIENENTDFVLESDKNKQEVFVSSEQVNLGDQTNDNQNVQTGGDINDNGIQPLKKWNWGAFILPFWWCLFSYCYWQMILCLIPYVNIVWRFIVAAKGNDWSWKTGKWKDVEYFNGTQRLWNKVGLIFVIVLASIVVVSMVAFIISDFFVRY